MIFFRPKKLPALIAKNDVNGVLRALRYRKSRSVRIDAAEALGRMGGSAAVPRLIEALRDSREDFLVRETACEALGRIGDARALEPLIERLGTNKKDMFDKAALALGRLKDARAVDALARATSRRWPGRTMESMFSDFYSPAAFDALAAIKPRGVEALCGILLDPNAAEGRRVMIARLFGSQPSWGAEQEQVRSTLERVIRDLSSSSHGKLEGAVSSALRLVSRPHEQHEPAVVGRGEAAAPPVAEPASPFLERDDRHPDWAFCAPRAAESLASDSGIAREGSASVMAFRRVGERAASAGPRLRVSGSLLCGFCGQEAPFDLAETGPGSEFAACASSCRSASCGRYDVLGQYKLLNGIETWFIAATIQSRPVGKAAMLPSLRIDAITASPAGSAGL